MLGLALSRDITSRHRLVLALLSRRSLSAARSRPACAWSRSCTARGHEPRWSAGRCRWRAAGGRRLAGASASMPDGTRLGVHPPGMALAAVTVMLLALGRPDAGCSSRPGGRPGRRPVAERLGRARMLVAGRRQHRDAPRLPARAGLSTGCGPSCCWSRPSRGDGLRALRLADAGRRAGDRLPCCCRGPALRTAVPTAAPSGADGDLRAVSSWVALTLAAGALAGVAVAWWRRARLHHGRVSRDGARRRRGVGDAS